jgi:AcrR family transcriptional regulator
MREEISAYKRERILEEAVKLFYERGFSGTTLDDIAGKLGVTKPFIYTHFRSKVELLESICRPTIEMSLGAIAEAAQQPGTASERLFDGIVNFSKVVLQRQANIAVYFREEKHLSAAGLAEINALRKRFDRVLSELLEEGARGGGPGDRRHGELGLHLVPARGPAADRRGGRQASPFRSTNGWRAASRAVFYSTLKPRLIHASRAAGVDRKPRKARASAVSPALVTANG